jgi:hypothetical protein
MLIGLNCVLQEDRSYSESIHSRYIDHNYDLYHVCVCRSRRLRRAVIPVNPLTVGFTGSIFPMLPLQLVLVNGTLP